MSECENQTEVAAHGTANQGRSFQPKGIHCRSHESHGVFSKGNAKIIELFCEAASGSVRGIDVKVAVQPGSANNGA
jgi:hypothetical protein